MITLLEYINKRKTLTLKESNWEDKLGKIIFQLDEASLEFVSYELKQMILEGNHVVWTSNDGDDLRMGDHAIQRQDRPQEKGGDGERIKRDEIINMFKWAWGDIMEMNYDGKLKKFYDKKNQRKVDAWTLECQCYLKDKNGQLTCEGARPIDKTLWAVWFIEENGNKVDLIIKTIFRGERINHSIIQERIRIRRNGNIEKRYKK